MEEGLLESEEIKSEDLESDEHVHIDDVDDIESSWLESEDVVDMDDVWFESDDARNKYVFYGGEHNRVKDTKQFTFLDDGEEVYYDMLLTQGKVVTVNEEQFEIVKNHRWSAAYRGSGLWYATTTIGNDTVYMHQLLTDFQYEKVDHINGDGLFNIPENLRDGTHLNNRNRKNAIGAYYVTGSNCYRAYYTAYNGKPEEQSFYVRNYASKKEARNAASDWYKSNNICVERQIEKDGPCSDKDRHKPTARTSNSGEQNIVDYTDKNTFRVMIKRDGKYETSNFSYASRPKEEALQDAIVWRDEFIAANPPKPRRVKKKQKPE
jgi:hypothetical protein